MRLKIVSRSKSVRWQFDVVSLKEAHLLAELHSKPTDRAYLYFELGEKVAKEHIPRAENGRILSNKEVAKLSFTALKHRPCQKN